MKRINSLFFLLALIFFACSSAEQTTQQSQKKEPDVYVFDDVSKNDSTKNEPAKAIPQQPVQDKTEKKEITPPAAQQQQAGKKFIVQLGAFSTKERAETFVKENQNKTELVMNISFNSQKQFFVVQLSPFSSREEAEKARSILWQLPAFKGAFIITTE